MKDEIVGKVVIHLLVDDLLQHLAEGGQDGYRPIVLRFQLAQFFVKGYQLGIFPLGWEFLSRQQICCRLLQVTRLSVCI